MTEPEEKTNDGFIQSREWCKKEEHCSNRNHYIVAIGMLIIYITMGIILIVNN